MLTNKPWAPRVDTVASYRKAGPLPDDVVSVCVTNFNYADYLPDCLDSLAEQTHRAIDLVIVDDLSECDASVVVAAGWLKRNHRRFHQATLLRHGRNQGPSEARNTGFRHASSEYVFVIDADNEAYPRTITRLFQAIQSSGADAAYPQIELFGEKRGIGAADIWDPATLHQSNYVDVMGIVRKSAWEKVAGYSHIDKGWEDYDFWLKFVDAGLAAAYVPEILCRYRVHQKSRTATEAHAAHEDLKLIMAFRHPVVPEAPAIIPEQSTLQGSELDVKETGASLAKPFRGSDRSSQKSRRNSALVGRRGSTAR
jgi:glycosyltransferase involved in cell wall biosynthesis